MRIHRSLGHNISIISLKWDVGPTLVYCWASIVDGEPTVNLYVLSQRRMFAGFTWIIIEEHVQAQPIFTLIDLDIVC